MRKQISGSVLLAAAVAGIGAAATGAQPGLCASAQTWRTQLTADPTGAVGLAASTLLWLLIGLVAVGVIATVLGRLPGALGRVCDAVSKRLLPVAMRRALHLMIGVTVGVTALAPSGAWATNAAFTRPEVSVTAPADSLPSPLPTLGEPGGPVAMPATTAPLPQLATTAHPRKSPVRQAVSPPKSTPKTPAWPGIDATMAGAIGATPAADAAAVAVTPGDSLWVLAARDLARRDGGGAVSDAAIAAEWPRWWAANRAAIGTDPDLLIPGQRLTPPA